MSLVTPSLRVVRPWPDFTQTLLHQLRAHAKTAAMAATSFAGDSPLFLLDYVLRLVRVIVLLEVWRSIFAGKGVVSGMTLDAVLTYTLISEVFAEQLRCKTELKNALWNGTVATRFLQPVGLVGQFASEMMGQWLFNFAFFSLPLFLIAPLLGVNPLPAHGIDSVLFGVSLALGVSIGLALEFIFGALIVTLDVGVWVIDSLRSALSVFLSGSLLPLALLPWAIGDVFAWLPFASIASTPLRLYTSSGNALWLMTLQVFWSLVLWPVATWLWRLNREHLTGYGG